MAYNDYLHFPSKAGLPLIAIVVWMIIAHIERVLRSLRTQAVWSVESPLAQCLELLPS